MERKTIMKVSLIPIAAVALTLGTSGCDGKSFNKAVQSMAASSSGSQKASMSPKATVQHFILRCQAADFEGAKKYFTQSMKSRMTGNGSGDGAFLKMMFQNCRITDVEEGYGTATVYIRVQNPMTSEWQTIPIPLVLEDGNWRISQLGDD